MQLWKSNCSFDLPYIVVKLHKSSGSMSCWVARYVHPAILVFSNQTERVLAPKTRNLDITHSRDLLTTSRIIINHPGIVFPWLIKGGHSQKWWLHLLLKRYAPMINSLWVYSFDVYDNVQDISWPKCIVIQSIRPNLVDAGTRRTTLCSQELETCTVHCTHNNWRIID